ncbi:M35 family metallo-endopeptidase [Actinoplanes oblitus]|uniref:M35 family metallo-endopeptidase n=1 Tax=Actinoplanes oblitus TaxID=3040509 RepID=A0ABY8W9H2_9ACTN|nr:M35 family metallo-endopeptidase [Actinoplanes oblitus]WIM94147.1 M35 family metallo-endopeptidase [Actinoplanes oblitus]
MNADAATAADATGLTTTVQIDEVSSSSLTVRLTTRNTSSSPVSVLSRDLPRAGLSGGLLAVTRDGVPLPYHGRLVKYAKPTAADYTRIPAGGTYAVTMNLADDYDLSRPGTFTIALAATRIRALRGPGAAVADTVRVRAGQASVSTTVAIQGARKPAGVAAASSERVKVAASAVTIVYNSNCSTSQKTSIRQAVTDAATLSTKSKTWLSNNPNGGAAYTEWFGTRTTTRFNTVASEYSNITSELTSKTVTLSCLNEAGVYAYVYPDDPYKIYLCGAFWTAPAIGTDSKAGTLVHESSHFTVNGGTDDWAYGQTAARNLASTNPARAVNNADNYEYFAESR